MTSIENDIPLKKVRDTKISVAPPEESKGITPFDLNKDKSSVTITVVGASGDLAKRRYFLHFLHFIMRTAYPRFVLCLDRFLVLVLEVPVYYSNLIIYACFVRCYSTSLFLAMPEVR